MKRILYVFVFVALMAGSAEAVTYLKSDDKVILNDGTELVGTVVFKAATLVVIMVEGEEKHIKMVDIKTIEMAPDVTGMVEKRKGDEPPVKKEAEEEPAETPGEKPEEKKPAEKPEEKPKDEEKPDEAVEPKPEPKPVGKPPAEETKKEEKAGGE